MKFSILTTEFIIFGVSRDVLCGCVCLVSGYSVRMSLSVALINVCSVTVNVFIYSKLNFVIYLMA